MAHVKSVIPYINRTKQLCTDLKAMSVTVTDQELALTVLCALRSNYEHLIVAIDAVADDEKLTIEFVKSRQKEKQNMKRSKSTNTQLDLAMIGGTEKHSFARLF